MLYYEIIAKHQAETTALIFKETRISYGELRKAIDRAVAYLQNRGLRRGERVGLLSKNCSAFVIAYFAVIRAGGVVVPFNFQLAPREIAYIVNDASLKFMLAKEVLPLEEALAEIGYQDLCQITFAEFAEATEGRIQEYPLTEDDNCTIIYTSGTTGKPKGAMLSHKNLVANASDFTQVVSMYPTDIGLCVLPMYHCFAWTVSVTGMLLKGGCIVVQETYLFKDTMDLIALHKVNTFAGVPTMIQLFYKGAEAGQLANIRWFISGGAPLPQVLAEGFHKKFGKPVEEGYGLSEASPGVAVNPAAKVKVGSIGPALPNVAVKILDEDDQELQTGAVGELCVRGNNVMLGYLNLPEETAKTLRDGWLHTGDLAYLDDDGYLFIVDRLKDMIISSGENIYPREIEEVLYAHPEIEEAAVIGIPDKLRGQAVCAYVVAKDGIVLEKKALRKYLLGCLAAYKVPREFFFCGQLPKNSTGKILKTALREQALIDMVARKR